VLLGAAGFLLPRPCPAATSIVRTILSGALPPGLTLASDGFVSGVPTCGGNFSFWLELSDEDPPSASWCRPAKSQRLFTIVGEPGVGKSRLVREFLSGLPATVAAGRCPPYGEGITYWPVVEALKQLGTRPPEPEAAAAIASLLRESETVAPAEEIAWAFRRTLETAARYHRRALEFHESTGNTGAVSGVAPLLARELCALGRYDEAAPLAERGRRAAAEWDVWGQVEWRRAQALVDAAAGRQADAERLAREAVAIAERTDALGSQGDALSDLAEVLLSSGQRKEAVAVLEQALERYERKEPRHG